MSKSVYSLVLMDEVVAGIDRAAYLSGTSRSNMINRILAEYLTFATPEARAKTIFSRMQELLAESTALSVSNLSDSSLCLRSALSYKYNPTIRYTVELRPLQGEGILKAALRTQNQALVELTTGFFTLWNTLETYYLTPKTGHPPRCNIGPGKYERIFILQEEDPAHGQQNPGEDILAYIHLLDKTLKLYFAHADNLQQARLACERHYVRYAEDLHIL